MNPSRLAFCSRISGRQFSERLVSRLSPAILRRKRIGVWLAGFARLHRLIVNGSFALFTLAVTLGISMCAEGQERPVAFVNGRAITDKEVDNLVIAQTHPLEEKLYAIRKAALENLITARLLEDEAQKRGIPVGEFRRQLTAGDVEVTSSEVETAYAENASFFASLSPDEAKERLRLDLETQQRMQNYRLALSKLRQGARIDLLLSEPRISIASLNDSAPSLGPAGASVTIVEYSDFECPYCRQVQATLKRVTRDYDGRIRLVFKNLPLQIHEHALLAARAAFCANEQGKFWQYHDALFAAKSLAAEALHQAALSLKLDPARFRTCLDSEPAQTSVRSDLREAERLGINSAPVFIVNGKLVRGAISFEAFKAIIEGELQTAQHSSQP